MKFNIYILLIFFTALLFIVSACSKDTVSICGDGVCDNTESCECNDCKNEPKCTETRRSCDDNNKCTTDVFNELTEECENTVIKNCCGNDICEESERCNLATYETVCAEDCPRTCPTKLIVCGTETCAQEESITFSCADTGCSKTGSNKFTINRNSGIRTYVVNTGELASGPIVSNFNCKREGDIANDDQDSIKGVIFSDSFEGEETITSLNSRVSVNNRKIYSLNFNRANLELSSTVECTITISSVDQLRHSEIVALYFPKSGY